jgi:type IV pilus assembly protein PilA
MSIRKRLQSGFTLVELMIVVAIIGILAVLAVYGVKKYMANSKTAEARQNLGRIGKDAASSYEGEKMDPKLPGEGKSTDVTRQLCDSAAATVPPALASVKGKKYQSNRADWAADSSTGLNGAPKGFACLRFELNTPQYYMYTWSATGYNTTTPSFNAYAQGDLDGNGTSSEFELTGKVPSSKSARLNIAPTLKETDADE